MVAKKNPEAEKTPIIESRSMEELVEQYLSDHIPAHQLSAREQLMIQWPGNDWERR